ncbi:MAG: YraN family protein [Gemmatimonadaceae bacterium]
MTTARQELGKRGELIAERWLEERGWRVVERRFRSGHRDIDLVMEQLGAEGRLVAFVEVKTRASDGYGGPLGAIHWRKRREMTRAAREWLAKKRREGDSFRFDIVGVLYRGGVVEVVHVEDAFRVR